MSKVLLIAGDQPRHRFIAQTLADAGQLGALIIEAREDLVPAPPPGLENQLLRLFARHFSERQQAEQHFFVECLDAVGWLGAERSDAPVGKTPSDVPTLHIERSDLNTPLVTDFIEPLAPDLTVTYGVGLLAHDTRARIPGTIWNLHGGLSPWYRGVATLFWPSYMLEPQMTGMTIHELTGRIDGGPIVHQCAAPLVRGDGLHQLACRAVRQIAAELPRLIEMFRERRLQAGVPQRTVGKLWLARDWQPAHLRLIYEQHENRIVDEYLDGRMQQREPQLIRQW